MEPPAFSYANLLGREYNDTEARARGVTYATSFYGGCDRTIHFRGEPVTEKAAIARVEAALSKPLSLRYYASICGDLLWAPRLWEDAALTYPTRGSCLGASGIRRAVLGPDGYLTPRCDV